MDNKPDNSGQDHTFVFAGGGTGGHLYPNLAIAEEIQQRLPQAEIIFFCSSREIDARIMSPTGLQFLPLPAVGFSASPIRAIRFFAQFVKSYYFVKQILYGFREGTRVIATGGFVSAPVVMAARSLKIPVYLLNVDSVAGKANRFLARYAKKIFLQFQQTDSSFANRKAQRIITGCPLRKDFINPDPASAIKEFGLDPSKKVLLVTGASSGAHNINQAVLSMLPDLDEFADSWQIVHLTGAALYEQVKQAAPDVSIAYHSIEYTHHMVNLLAAANLVIGRAGAVSIAEYIASGTPVICLPYPYHKDRHQYKNAQVLVDAGAAVIVDDNIDNPAQTAEDLYQEIVKVISNDALRKEMSCSYADLKKQKPASDILDAILA